MGNLKSTTAEILIVDDNEDTLSFMEAALVGEGYVVRTTTSGRNALALQSERPADLLISDIFMPEQDGIETLWHCKNRFPQTRTIAMSAGGNNPKYDYLSAAMLLEVDTTLRKPFTVTQLADAVRGVLQSPGGAGSRVD